MTTPPPDRDGRPAGGDDARASDHAAAAAVLGVASRDGRVLKAHGTGNDFVVVVDVDDELVLTPEVVVALCDRHRGIGADGVIRIGGGPPADVDADLAATVADAPVFMDYRNGDGTIVEMCGNGVRVVAKVVHDRGVLPWPEDARLVIGTRAGLRPVAVMGDALPDVGPVVTHVTVDMGPPIQSAEAVGLGLTRNDVDGDIAGFHLDGDDIPTAMSFAGMSMGNPHAVTVVPDVDTVSLATLGPAVEHHPAFSHGVNVNVVAVADPGRVHLRVWERGVGETQACGTGACATTAAMAAAGHVDLDHPVRVEVPGGTLVIERDERGHLLMTGPAEVVATVFLDPEWLAARAAAPSVG